MFANFINVPKYNLTNNESKKTNNLLLCMRLLNLVMSDADDFFRCRWWMCLVSHPQSLVILVIKSSILGFYSDCTTEVGQWLNPFVSLQVIEKHI